ncbi:collagen-like protein [Flavobacteriaceae bacterium]|nr:collagen-like protein [Flavobacteriaceae bacterium]
MKKITLFTLALFSVLSYAQVGINTNTPDSSSALDIESTTGGILIPRLTETQLDAISSPATGLMIYQTDQTTGFYFYDGTAWARIEGVAGQQGEPGPTGPQGPQGLQGVAGNDGADGTNGVDGSNGSSAYEIWVAAGNTGTEAEFLASLVGAQGETGAQGTQGIQGETGATGPTGSTGPQGPQGIQGPAGNDGADGTNGVDGSNGSSAYQIWITAGNTGTEAEFLTSLVGAQGETGAQGPSGSSLTQTNIDLNCESIQELEIGSMVYNSNNASGSLNIVTPGPDCSESPTKLFSSPQTDNGLENRYYYWIFNVSESIYVYNLPVIQRDGASAGTRLYKLQNYYESTLSAANVGDALSNSQNLLYNSTNSSIFILLEPGITYVLRSGDVSNYNNPNHYSSSLPPYDESLFISLGQFKLAWGSSTYETTTRWGLGVAGQMEGFSYSSPGKIFQTIVNW